MDVKEEVARGSDLNAQCTLSGELVNMSTLIVQARSKAKITGGGVSKLPESKPPLPPAKYRR